MKAACSCPYLPLAPGFWIKSKDGDPGGLELYKRHYSARHYADGRRHDLFVGPGEKMVLITPELNALFVWRKFISLDHQEGINCSIFRNESPHLSSAMILEAEEFAVERWGKIRAYTYINKGKIRSSNPGYCFQVAGWQRCGLTKGGLVILEKYLGWEEE